MKLLSSIALEINEFRERSNRSSVHTFWKEKSEIFTAENNFTVCFGLEDCVRTALDSLDNLPLVSPEHIHGYKDTVSKLKNLLLKVMLNNTGAVPFKTLSDASYMVIGLLVI